MLNHTVVSQNECFGKNVLAGSVSKTRSLQSMVHSRAQTWLLHLVPGQCCGSRRSQLGASELTPRCRGAPVPGAVPVSGDMGLCSSSSSLLTQKVKDGGYMAVKVRAGNLLFLMS